MSFYISEDYSICNKTNIFINIQKSLFYLSSPTILYRYSFLNLSYFQQTVLLGHREEKYFKES